MKAKLRSISSSAVRSSMGLLGLTVFQFVGDALAGLLPVAIPGPVLGFVVLALVLTVIRGRGGSWMEYFQRSIEEAASRLHLVLPLLFVPAAARGLGLAPSLGERLILLGGAVLLSTLLALTVTGHFFQVAKLGPEPPEVEEEGV